MFTVPMQSKNAEEKLESFKKIIRANGDVMPKEITVDLGNEFALLKSCIKERAAF